MTLYEKDIPFVEELVNINLGDQYRDEFLQMNPKAEVPVIKDRDKGTVVSDSLLITLYLEDFSMKFRKTKFVF
jgi:glutathione S-transferase